MSAASSGTKMNRPQICGIVWSNRIDVDSRDEGPVIEAIKQVGAQVVGVTGVCLVA